MSNLISNNLQVNTNYSNLSSVQNKLLDIAFRKSAMINLVLKNKTKVYGKVLSFDSFTILVINELGHYLVFKQAVSIIKLIRNFNKKKDNSKK